MKFQKPSKKSTTDSALLVGTATVGAMLSNGVVGLLPNGKSLTTSSIAAITAALLASTKVGSGKTADAVKGLFTGMAIEQAVQVVKEVATKYIDKEKISNQKLKGFVGNVFGLNGTGLNGTVEFLPFGNNNAAFDAIWDAPIVEQEAQEVNLVA